MVMASNRSSRECIESFRPLQRMGTPDDRRKRRGISCGGPGGLRQWAAFANYRRSTGPIFERVPEMVGRVKSIAAELDELQSLLIARTSGKRCTSAMKFASSGEVLSLFHASASGNGMFRSATDRMTTLPGHRQRAVLFTHPTPMPCDTRLRIVASFRPS